jgi:hypothetical protein
VEGDGDGVATMQEGSGNEWLYLADWRSNRLDLELGPFPIGVFAPVRPVFGI